MLRACCLVCAVEEAHSSLPQVMEHPSRALPWAQHCAGPMCLAVTVGWMVQRNSSLHPSPRSSGNVLFWKHLRGEYFRGDSSIGIPFHSTPLGKACSPLVSIFGEHSLPILTPVILLSATPSPPSHMSTLCPLCLHIRKNQTDRDAQKLQRFLGETLVHFQ